MPGGSDLGEAVVVDPTGRIVVAGQSGGSQVVWRFNDDGSPDNTFGGLSTGCTVNGAAFGCIQSSGAAGGATDEGFGLVLDSQGRIVEVGTSFNSGGQSQLTLWRHNSDGTPDTTFNGGSNFTTGSDVGGGTSVNPANNSMGIFLDFAGRIIVASYGADANALYNLVLWRFIP